MSPKQNVIRSAFWKKTFWGSWLSTTPLLLLTLFDVGSAQSHEKGVMDSLFGPRSSYDPRIRPPADGRDGSGATIVHVNLFIRSIEKISEKNMDMKLQMTLRQEWFDKRLVYASMGGKIKYLTLNDKSKLWTPDLFFKNEKKANFHDLMEPNNYLRIFPDGGVIHSSRITLTLSCPMDLRLFPMDRQECAIKIASYGHTTEDLVLLWKEINPVQVTRSLHLPEFTLEKFTTDYCNSKTITGEYSCIYLKLVFQREHSYYVTQHYIPICMMVIISWMSFWLTKTTPRIILCIVTIATFSMQLTKFYEDLPRVSYTKAIDVWNGVCMMFLFGALTEAVLVNYVSRFDGSRSQTQDHEQPPDVESQTEDLAESEQKPSDSDKEKGKPTKMSIKTRLVQELKSSFPKAWSLRIDVISRIAFPLVFCFFVICYFSAY